MGEPKEGRTQSNTHDPQTLQQAVALALQDEPDLRGHDIQVDVNHDRVILQGVVDVLAQKVLAGQIARQVEGVKAVDNAVTISTDGSITDADVEFEVAEEINADSTIQLKDVGVDVEGGNARLIGEVDSPEERKAAEQAASRARGVRRIFNQVKIRNKE